MILFRLFSNKRIFIPIFLFMKNCQLSFHSLGIDESIENEKNLFDKKKKQLTIFP